MAVALLAVAIAGLSLQTYAQGTLRELAHDGVGLAATYEDAPLVIQGAFYVHVVSASIALVIGPVQFLRRLRERHPRLHRAGGRVYLTAVVVAAAAALLLAPWNTAGLVGLFGFGTLGVLWLVTAVRAYRAIRRGDVRSHQAWVMRSYALTFAGPTLRLWLAVLILGQVALGGATDEEAVFAAAYAVVPFLCWLPNLVVAEWLIRRRGLPAYRLAAA
ncbi:DUF2306 domain-containing protein [Oerskovia flava]|uniref:DUF2306 domain-containing protein n=1 Tax=Oerskovia flava TaxID=2986422 RepID=UPI00223EA68B|nr:DUF2306 domain-containing protein [Oerskovia sp. JB1-3-2]